MMFNNLKVGMIVGEVLSKNDKGSPTQYNLKEILKINPRSTDSRMQMSADIKLIEISYFNEQFVEIRNIKMTVGPKFFGLSRPLSELEYKDKVNFIKAIFESKK